MVCDFCIVRSTPLKMFCVIAMLSVPERRITAIAETPGAVASATMVSLMDDIDYLSDGKLIVQPCNQHGNFNAMANSVNVREVRMPIRFLKFLKNKSELGSS